MGDRSPTVLYDANDIPGSPTFPETPYNSLPPTIPQSQTRIQPRRTFSTTKPPLTSRPSLLDELLPVPITSHASSTTILAKGSGGSATNSMTHSLRRSGSLAIIFTFLISVVFVAVTTDGLSRSTGLRDVFRIGSLAGTGGMQGVEVLDGVSENGSGSGLGSGEGVEQIENKPDFDKYLKLQTIPPSHIQLDARDHRLIFIGDVHGSLGPLKRLMDKLRYNPLKDRLIHVGDLIAKGTKNDEVLTWMRENRIQGVRGNHDQPVIQWRAWMEWAGGVDWEASLDSIAAGGEDGAISELKKQGKMFPKEWEWHGEHWKIARTISKANFQYLLDLPLVLHLPSLHTLIVHAGLLPSNPLKSFTDPTQPLEVSAQLSSSSSTSVDTLRTSTELSILSIPQNKLPWNLLNMRSIYLSPTKSHKAGEITKNGKKGKGTPWSEVWGREMKRCTGAGSWLTDGMGEAEVEEGSVEEVDDDGVEGLEETEVDEVDKRGKPGSGSGMSCSPVTVIYGHAAGRGLDIKQFSKGIDTGCVYGHELTALVLGDLSNLKGKNVRVDEYRGKLVSVSCKEGGL